MICLGHCFFFLQFPKLPMCMGYGSFYLYGNKWDVNQEFQSMCCIGMCWDVCFVQTLELLHVWGYVFILLH